MAPGDCDICRHLHESVTLASTRHSALRTRLSIAVLEDPNDDAKIAALERVAEVLEGNRREALARYNNHRLAHRKALTAADGPSAD